MTIHSQITSNSELFLYKRQYARNSVTAACPCKDVLSKNDNRVQTHFIDISVMYKIMDMTLESSLSFS